MRHVRDAGILCQRRLRFTRRRVSVSMSAVHVIFEEEVRSSANMSVISNLGGRCQRLPVSL